MANLIAFEIMYKDLGESHSSIEKLLDKCGIIGYEKEDILLDYFKENGDNIYELSKTMRIEDTPNMYLESKKVHDYFYIKEFDCKEYKDIVDFSCRYANAIIMNAIINKALSLGVEIKPLMIKATKIVLIVSMEDKDKIKDALIDDVSIRIFGRRFKTIPNIQVL